MSMAITFDNFRVTGKRVSSAKWNRAFLVAPLMLMGVGSVVPFGGKAPLLGSLLGTQAVNNLTIVARADGTFDIKEFPKADQWFAPDVVGEGLKVTAAQRFGGKTDIASVNVLVKADPGASDEAVHMALVSARNSGFVRFGFADPRLGQVVKQVASTPAPTVAVK